MVKLTGAIADIHINQLGKPFRPKNLHLFFGNHQVYLANKITESITKTLKQKLFNNF